MEPGTILERQARSLVQRADTLPKIQIAHHLLKKERQISTELYAELSAILFKTQKELMQKGLRKNS